jgi:hypothetical protein
MHKMPFENKIVLASIALLLVVSISISTNNLSFAFLGFDLGGSSSSTDQYLGSSQRSIQGAHCYSPNASIINSCNSGDATASESLGHNMYDNK